MAGPAPLADFLKGLRASLAVARSGSTARAADSLHLSQSTVVRCVQDLELHLGEPLFERQARGMVPTPLGQVLVERAERALGQLAAADRVDTARAGWLASRLACGLAHRHLRALMLLVQTRSERLTAQALQVSPAAVQQTLAQLEHLSGSALFIRARRGLRLTERGETVLQAARLALAELEDAQEDLSALRGSLQARVVIGSLPFSTSLFLPQAVEAALQRQQGLSVTIIDGTWDNLLQQLRDARLDLIVGALRPQAAGDGFVQAPLFTERLSVVAGAGHPLAGRSRLGWSDLRDARWILPMPGTPAEAALREELARARLPFPSGQLQTNSAMMMQALLVQGVRLALMSPRQVQAELQAGWLVELPVPVRHAARTIGVVTRAGYLPPAGATAVLDAIASACAPFAGAPAKASPKRRR